MSNEIEEKYLENQRERKEAFEIDRLIYLEKERKRKEERSEEKNAQFLQQLTAIADENEQFVSQLAHSLAIKDLSSRTSQTQLHSKWKDKVFEPVQQQVTSLVESDRSCFGRKMKMKQYEDYLRASKKQNVFLNIVEADKYNPFVSCEASIHYKPPSVDKDPIESISANSEKEREFANKIRDAGDSRKNLQYNSLPAVSSLSTHLLSSGTSPLSSGHFSPQLTKHSPRLGKYSYQTNLPPLLLPHADSPTARSQSTSSTPIPSKMPTKFSAQSFSLPPLPLHPASNSISSGRSHSSLSVMSTSHSTPLSPHAAYHTPTTRFSSHSLSPPLQRYHTDAFANSKFNYGNIKSYSSTENEEKHPRQIQIRKEIGKIS
ncbi:uncharacterized protein MONOS_6560 [Monocercomonoides exilis]|uniref:uncharacterized protein n=1 Tax=Monocercomonoides exilis TaxID=2049356 RepID=UPI00355A014A|nr:hypothetical protein MONOS_6560 [Monocercomonoides exilis]|eukprot:MONOS_6560.1-p1 / transcript=MONOS_6560.1 / gene=MONOS_6560 / organism=Monocercomonoides_exilis_PA203 / gene_product=unspecified product / transcript_product=unspecified product / location=Mono_scaffold00208:52774-54101(-) / protein_length=374 / sequence_SO=supercontig / SO=protein_coding / is_pseudo=false